MSSLIFMSKIRQYPDLSNFQNFGQLIKTSFGAAKHICEPDYIHLVFDSYFELSVKDGGRARRTEDVGGIIKVVAMGELTPIPKQIQKFWASSKAKENIQLLARKMALLYLEKLVLSGMVVNNEIVKAQMQEQLGCAADESLLPTWGEEADIRLLSHIDWSVEKGCERIIVLSNDTDTVVQILRHITAFFEKGLQEMWVEFGTGEHRREIPLHCLHAKLGEHFCNILLKAHVMSGNDVVSKIGRKYAEIT